MSAHGAQSSVSWDTPESSLAAIFDDLNHLNDILNDLLNEILYNEECYLRSLNNMDGCRPQSAAAESKAERLQRVLDNALVALSEWQSKISNARKLLHSEREIAIEKCDSLGQENQLLNEKVKILEVALAAALAGSKNDQAMDGVKTQQKEEKQMMLAQFSDSLKKLAFLNGTPFLVNDKEKLDAIPQFNSTGTFLMNASVSRSEDDLDSSVCHSYIRPQRSGILSPPRSHNAPENPPGAPKKLRYSNSTSDTQVCPLTRLIIMAAVRESLRATTTLEQTPTEKVSEMAAVGESPRATTTLEQTPTEKVSEMAAVGESPRATTTLEQTPTEKVSEMAAVGESPRATTTLEQTPTEKVSEMAAVGESPRATTTLEQTPTEKVSEMAAVGESPRATTTLEQTPTEKKEEMTTNTDSDPTPARGNPPRAVTSTMGTHLTPSPPSAPLKTDCESASDGTLETRSSVRGASWGRLRAQMRSRTFVSEALHCGEHCQVCVKKMCSNFTGNIPPIDWTNSCSRKMHIPTLHPYDRKVFQDTDDMMRETASPSEADVTKYNEAFEKGKEVLSQPLDEEKLKTLSIAQLSDIHLSLEDRIRSNSETLIWELVLRDELVYEKETKNTFICLLLAVQNKRRQYHVDKRNGEDINNNGNESPNLGSDPKYLTTVIPYHLENGLPDNQSLQALIRILKAINEDSPTVPTLLADLQP